MQCYQLQQNMPPFEHVRNGKQTGISPLTGNKLKTKPTTAVKNVTFCDHVVPLQDFITSAWRNSRVSP